MQELITLNQALRIWLVIYLGDYLKPLNYNCLTQVHLSKELSFLEILYGGDRRSSVV